MKRKLLPLALMAALAGLSACNKEAQGSKAVSADEAVKEANGKTIAAGLSQDSRFLAAAKAAGIDATLAGPGPYTVLVPDDAAFEKMPAGTIEQMMKPESRAELSQLLTYHILPGTVLAADIGKAIDDAEDKKAVLATMGGKTLTFAREGDRIVLSDSAGTKATLAGPDETRSNGVVHHIDAVMMPPKA
ncbi:MAG TPA: fasciclin domain-containing protein [Sphingomicrobium sp.]|nr:fasciclin domain-containing protein [Sphingomicrobium sp.]